MQVIRLVCVLLIGLLLPGFAFFLSKMSLQIANKNTHSKNEVIPCCILTLIYAITAISAGFFLLRAHPMWRSINELMPLLIMCTVAYFDTLSGRIPITFFFISLLVGMILGFQSYRWLWSLLGGLSNLMVGILLYWFGNKHYAKRHPHVDNQSGAFGMGDVYAAGAIGALLAVPMSLVGLLIALIASLVIAIIHSLIDQKPLLSRYIQLGPGFLLATILLLLLF